MSQKLLFIYNPISGQSKIKSVLADVIDCMIKADYEVTVYPTQQPRDAITKVADEAALYDRIICSGGDGTLDEVVTGLMNAQIERPVGFIPTGSTNDFANSLNLSSDPIDAARVAVSDDLIRCDVGRFKEDYFVYVAAFGLFTEASYATSQELKNLIGHTAYILEGVRQLTEIPSVHMTVENDGQILEGNFLFGMVTNSVTIGGIKGLITEEVGLNDGLFEVTLIETPGNPLELSEILGFFTNLNRQTRLVHTFHAAEIKFASEEKVAWTLDGEFGGEHDTVTILNIPGQLEIAHGNHS